jgi:hypothetical protein
LSTIELHRTRTSFNRFPSLPSMPVRRCTKRWPSRRTARLKRPLQTLSFRRVGEVAGRRFGVPLSRRLLNE